MGGASAASLNQRIRNEAADLGVPAIRLRNRIGFQRILARLSRRDDWVLKGGFSLEVRLGLDARATKDLDLLRLTASRLAAPELQDVIDEALNDDLGDGFAFRVRMPRPVRAEDVEPSTWRTVVDVRYDEAEFGPVTIDVVTLSADATTTTELLRIDATVTGESFTMPALDVHRHAGEKYHAYSRIYAYDRPSSRVKDLVDIVLLADSGLIESGRLGVGIRAVFAERGGPPPAQLPNPPRDWAASYRSLADETGTHVTDVQGAWRIAAELYEQALAQEGAE